MSQYETVPYQRRLVGKLRQLIGEPTELGFVLAAGMVGDEPAQPLFNTELPKMPRPIQRMEPSVLH